MLTRAYSQLAVKLRFLIVPAWIAASAACLVYLPSLGEAQRSPLGELVPKDAGALQVERTSNAQFAVPLLSRTVVVHRNAGGIRPAELRRIERVTLALRRGDAPGGDGLVLGLPAVNVLRRPPLTREQGTTALLYLFAPPNVGTIGRTKAARELVRRNLAEPDGSFTGVTGAGPARARQGELIESSLPSVELATLVLVVAIVGLHFRSVGAGLLNLAVIAVAYACATRVLAWTGGRTGVSIPHEVEPVIVVLLFGVLTDYTIFFLARFRAKLGLGLESSEAARQATRELGPIIVTAGVTVAGASASLAFARLGFFQAFGPGMALSILIAVIVAMTFVPAMLAILGPALFWPRRPDRAGSPAPSPRRSGAGRIVAQTASRHPVVAGVASLALLLGAASGLGRLHLGNPLIGGLPSGTEAARAYSEAARGWAPGVVAPSLVYLEGKDVAKRRGKLAKLERLLSRQPGVAAAVGPREQPLDIPLGAALSRSGAAARVLLIFDSDPYGRTALEDVHRIERRLPLLVAASGLRHVRAGVAGDTALSRQTIGRTYSDLARIAPIALLVTYLVLAVFLGSLVAPLYLVAASVLAVAAALGLATYVFSGVLGHESITYTVPFAAAVMLLSLGSDYNVYLVGRVKQEAGSRPLRDAVEIASEGAARSIAVAGIVLALSFALLAIVPLRSFRELAFTMFAGLMLDAFVVRSLLVPALIVLFGRGRGWPGSRLGHVDRPESPAVVEAGD